MKASAAILICEQSLPERPSGKGKEIHRLIFESYGVKKVFRLKPLATALGFGQEEKCNRQFQFHRATTIDTSRTAQSPSREPRS